MANIKRDLKQQLGINNNESIPANYNIPFFIHEEDMNRMEKIHKRESTWKNVIIIILIILFVGTNVCWIRYENQFEDVVTTEQDVDVKSNGNGDISLNTVGGNYYGKESESEASSN